MVGEEVRKRYVKLQKSPHKPISLKMQNVECVSMSVSLVILYIEKKKIERF